MRTLTKVFADKGGKRLKKNQGCQKKDETAKIKKKIENQFTFTKIAICFVLINSELQIWASYVLAFLGREAIAEALSQQIVITIIGTMVGYFVKSLVENLSKYTTLFTKKSNNDITSENNGQISFDDTDCYNNFGSAQTPPVCDGVFPIDTNEYFNGGVQ